MFKDKTVKYEVVVGVQTDISSVNRVIERQLDLLIEAWQKYAKIYFEKTGVYVSAIAIKGNAIYNEDWGCPSGGERVVTFNCTCNTKFIKDTFAYGRGVTFIASCLKKEFKQSTVTLTCIESDIGYITDEDNDKIENIIKKYIEKEVN